MEDPNFVGDTPDSGPPPDVSEPAAAAVDTTLIVVIASSCFCLLAGHLKHLRALFILLSALRGAHHAGLRLLDRHLHAEALTHGTYLL